MEILENAVGYCRVSTREQAQNSDALQNQIARVRDVIGPDAPLFSDVCSGTKTSRPGFNQMLELLGTGAYSSVVITRPDRLGRNQRTGFQQIVDWWTSKTANQKIQTVSLDVPIDLNVLGGRFNLAVMSEANIFEVDMTSARVRAIHKRNMEQGDVNQRPPFGYICVNGKMAPDEEKRHCFLSQKPKDACKTLKATRGVDPGVSNADLYRLLISSYLSTGSYNGAVQALGAWALTPADGFSSYYDKENEIYLNHRPTFPPGNHRGIKCLLFNPIYRGHRGHRRNYNPDLRPANGEARNHFNSKGSKDRFDIIHYDQHAPLLDEDDYAKILVIEDRLKKFYSESRNPLGVAGRVRSVQKYPLSGMLYCTCGRSLNVYTGSNRGQPTYRCRNISACNENVSIRADRAARLVAMHLHRMAVRIQAGEEALPPGNSGDEAQLAHLSKVLEHLRSCPDKGLVASQVQEIQRRIDAITGNPNQRDFLHGNARQILMDPRAADWAYWAAAADNHEFLLYRLPQLVERAVIAYPTPADRPARAGRGRPRAEQTGNPSVIELTLR
jgi:DNA invertase Pin-like site-specific DNA recombinase